MPFAVSPEMHGHSECHKLRQCLSSILSTANQGTLTYVYRCTLISTHHHTPTHPHELHAAIELSLVCKTAVLQMPLEQAQPQEASRVQRRSRSLPEALRCQRTQTARWFHSSEVGEVWFYEGCWLFRWYGAYFVHELTQPAAHAEDTAYMSTGRTNGSCIHVEDLTMQGRALHRESTPRRIVGPSHVKHMHMHMQICMRSTAQVDDVQQRMAVSTYLARASFRCPVAHKCLQ